MIYFDNSATTIEKPLAVKQAVIKAMETMGNPGRSFHKPAMDALRMVYDAREAFADMCKASSPLDVAFTSGATESLNLVCMAMVSAKDHVITTVLEHNSVLRPLYKTGCGLSFLGCEEDGQLDISALPGMLRKNTKYMFLNHGSNVLGNIAPAKQIYDFCRENEIVLVLDTAQTMGHLPVDASMADIICFTGHKALMGPQGTGGIISSTKTSFAISKTGGSGSNSFAHNQGGAMPDVFEAGTPNVHGIAGLRAAAEHCLKNMDNQANFCHKLTQRFINGLSECEEVEIYGPQAGDPRLPVVSINIKGFGSDEISSVLWGKYGIATRPGIHCAPLLHQRMKSENRGMVRFSFGPYNNTQEIDRAVNSIIEICRDGLK